MWFKKKKEPENCFYDMHALAELLANATKWMLNRTGNIKLSSLPQFDERPVTQFMHKLRVEGMEKFNKSTIISCVHMYVNEAEFRNENILGTVLVYLEADYAADFLQKMQYPFINDENPEDLKHACGTMANLVAGRFKTEALSQNMVDLFLSPFESHINSAVNGLDYNQQVKTKQEVSFFIDGQKRLVTELVSAPIPLKT